MVSRPTTKLGIALGLGPTPKARKYEGQSNLRVCGEMSGAEGTYITSFIGRPSPPPVAETSRPTSPFQDGGQQGWNESFWVVSERILCW
ncbi:hypothetical protein BaRGS_00017003, partial [Batillaria attramentaria]